MKLEPLQRDVPVAGMRRCVPNPARDRLLGGDLYSEGSGQSLLPIAWAPPFEPHGTCSDVG